MKEKVNNEGRRNREKKLHARTRICDELSATIDRYRYLVKQSQSTYVCMSTVIGVQY